MRLRRRLRAARPSLRVGRSRYPATVCPDGWSPPRRRWFSRGGVEQNPAYRPTRPPYVYDLHIQLAGAASVRSRSEYRINCVPRPVVGIGPQAAVGGTVGRSLLIRRCAPLVAKKVSGDDGRRCLGGQASVGCLSLVCRWLISLTS